MAFDTSTRNKLAKLVADARSLLVAEFSDQLQEIYGIQPDGNMAPVDKLVHLDDEQREVARLLRERVSHLAGGNIVDKKDLKAAIERMTRQHSFTILNRFAALRMCEERGLIQECVASGMQSKGFKVFLQVAGTGLGDQYDRYHTYINCVFDEIAVDLGVLFDRFSLMGRLFPREKSLSKLLEILNQPALQNIWAEDETIGWIYQYFNPAEERKAMRKASQAPRNFRELAVRNQFFTPRYVVEFLTDNTLGRIWYEMRKGDTSLKEKCRYMVRQPNEVFLAEDEKAPEDDNMEANLSQDELLNKTVYIEHRPKKDPRDIRVVDPACGSGHFLLYTFDLLERIYEEAWFDNESPKYEPSGQSLRDEFETIEDLQRYTPKLILEHNLHGIDIDPRAVQIAALALWLRAQKAWKIMGAKSVERPRIVKSNVVTAEPMPGNEAMRKEFTEGLKPRVLGQFVEVIFDKMKLAGEAGSLLKIEEEIKDAVAKAKKQWEEASQPEQQSLFPTLSNPRPKQMELGFDVKEITDERFWEQAEDQILEALKNYAERTENGNTVRRRLFADDAARGFAFIDLCRRRYDIALMNPPFGDFSKSYKTFARKDYPNSYNDILGAFVERWIDKLDYRCCLGAITSRTCFFLGSFSDWREKAVLSKSAIVGVADIGQGVMDNAMVEAAAYIIERSRPKQIIPFIRAITAEDREDITFASISAMKSGIPDPHLYLARQDSFKKLKGAPFVYWVESEDLNRLSSLPTFEPEAAEVRVGLQTGDDPRFVRAVWEVAPQDTQFVYYPANGETFCRLDDPIVLAYFRRRQTGTPRWAYHVKSGTSQPWYAPITLKLKYQDNGFELRNFYDFKGKPKAFLRSQQYYYRPGFSWTRRATRFYPYVIPSNCIPSVSRYMAFPKHAMKYSALGISASRIASAYMRFYGEKFKWPNFLVENLKALPWPKLSGDLQQFFHKLIQNQVSLRRSAYLNHEPFNDFLLPIKIKDFSNGGQSLAFDPKTLLGETGEQNVAKAYGFNKNSATRIERDVTEAIDSRHRDTTAIEENEITNDESGPNDDDDFALDFSETAQQETLLSYCIGCIFGRWDLRIAVKPSLAPKFSDPFDPPPICPPGMLIGPEGLPAEPDKIVSEEWLHARPDAITLPTESTLNNSTIPDSEYPLGISWDGVIVDDPGIDSTHLHHEDIVRRVREVLEVIWGDNAHNIEQEACDILGVPDLRTYFRKPSGFFQDHLKRYTKSRRKAPIYWPLSTQSGSYTLWIYYHRLTDQTLYTCVEDYLNPKIDDLNKDIERIQKEVDDGGNAKQRQQLEKMQDFKQELTELKNELLRVAALPYRPDLNDGVLITASPLWKLFRLKSWQKDLKACWDKLAAGEYDWAHLAYTIWPDQVKERCRTDRSIAIAHDLEHLCELEAKSTKKKKSKKTSGD